MHIKVYFGEAYVYLCKDEDVLLKQPTNHLTIKKPTNIELKNTIAEIEKNEFTSVIFIDDDFEALKSSFWSNFTTIEAAGGIVKNETDELLFINRLSKWDLPKGKIEKGESIETAALREVEEETGVADCTIKNKICETYHTYHAYGKYFLKTTYWFSINCKGKQNLIPQTEENITEISWITEATIDNVLQTTYPSIIDVVEQYYKMNNA